MTLQVIKGDLFDPAHNFNALAQGVNCQGVMGAGIAVPFKNHYPEMYEEYTQLCAQHKTTLPGLVHRYFGPYKTVYNMFTQVFPGADASYELLDRAAYCLEQLATMDYMTTATNDYWEGEAYRVGLPWIGCGIGGLQQHNVLYMLEKHLTESEVAFYIVEQE